MCQVIFAESDFNRTYPPTIRPLPPSQTEASHLCHPRCCKPEHLILEARCKNLNCGVCFGQRAKALVHRTLHGLCVFSQPTGFPGQRIFNVSSVSYYEEG